MEKLKCSHSSYKVLSIPEDIDDTEKRQCYKCGAIFSVVPNLTKETVYSGSGKKSTTATTRRRFSTRYGRRRSY